MTTSFVDKLISRYARQNGVGEKTAETYRDRLQAFAGFLGKVLEPSDMTAENYRRYVDMLYKKNPAQRAGRYARAVLGLWSAAARYGMLPEGQVPPAETTSVRD